MGSTKKLSDKWRFGSPKSKIARSPPSTKEGTDTSDQNDRLITTTDSQSTLYAPAPPRTSHQLQASSPSSSLRARGSEPSSAGEDDLALEYPSDTCRPGGKISRSPLPGFRKLFRLNRTKGKKSQHDERRAAGNLEKRSPRHADNSSNTVPPERGSSALFKETEDQSEHLLENARMGRVPPPDQDASPTRNGRGAKSDDSKHTREMLHDHGKEHAADMKYIVGRPPPRIVYVGVFLNGVAVTLASYAPARGADARSLVKAVSIMAAVITTDSTTDSSSGPCTNINIAVLSHRILSEKTQINNY